MAAVGGGAERDVGADLLAHVHPLQKYRARTIWRADIKNAEYNPRVISDQSRKKLRGGLEKLGLLQPLVWNGRSGTLVGGHQRLALLDKLAGGKPAYALQVAEVDLTFAEEVEANILLNNPETHGLFDLEKLDAALRTEGLRLEATGFDMADIMHVLGESPFALEHGVELQALAQAQRDVSGAIDAVTANLNAGRDREHFYIVVVFKDVEDSEKFMTTLGLEINTFQDGKRLHALLEPLYQQQRAEQTRIAEQSREAAAREITQMTEREAAMARDALVAIPIVDRELPELEQDEEHPVVGDEHDEENGTESAERTGEGSEEVGQEDEEKADEEPLTDVARAAAEEEV
jgi:hypothetical protein